MVERILFILMTSLSLIALAASPAFTPAVAVSLLIMFSCGITAIYGFLKVSVVNIAISSLTVAISPLGFGHFHSLEVVLMFGVPFLVGYGGIYWKVAKVQSNAM